MQKFGNNTSVIPWLLSKADQNTYKIDINFKYRKLLFHTRNKTRVLVFDSGHVKLFGRFVVYWASAEREHLN